MINKIKINTLKVAAELFAAPDKMPSHSYLADTVYTVVDVACDIRSTEEDQVTVANIDCAIMLLHALVANARYYTNQEIADILNTTATVLLGALHD